jgi:hypothetical protein
MTTDEYAPTVLQAGVDLGITPRGIVIGFATVYVESDWTMYANAAVPASMSIPHDAIGSDSFSVGLFQQQVVGPPWWWGDAATCMDPYKSAQLFFGRLANLDYNNTANTPGSYAQDVQQSADPDRYDQRMADAQALYDQLTAGGTVTAPTDPRLVALQAARPDFNEFPNWGPNSEDRQGTTIDLFLRHTEESSGYDNALGLSNFLISTAQTNNPVSYHYTISKGQDDDGVTVVDCIDTDQAAWAVGNSNLRSINLCYAGSSVGWDRETWIANLGRCIDVAGYLTVQDWIKYGGEGAPPVCAGPAYGLNPPVVSDHRYCTDWLKDGNTHVDVGDNYPWDLDAAAVAKYWAIANATAAPPADPTPPTAPAAPFDPTAPADAEAEILSQVRGRWGLLGGHTLVEAVGLILDKQLGTDNSTRTDFSW